MSKPSQHAKLLAENRKLKRELDALRKDNTLLRSTIPADARIAWVRTGSGAGTKFWRVAVLRETPSRFWVRLEESADLPRRGPTGKGTELYVSKAAVTFNVPTTTRSCAVCGGPVEWVLKSRDAPLRLYCPVCNA